MTHVSTATLVAQPSSAPLRIGESGRDSAISDIRKLVAAAEIPARDSISWLVNLGGGLETTLDATLLVPRTTARPLDLRPLALVLGGALLGAGLTAIVAAAALALVPLELGGSPAIGLASPEGLVAQAEPDDGSDPEPLPMPAIAASTAALSANVPEPATEPTTGNVAPRRQPRPSLRPVAAVAAASRPAPENDVGPTVANDEEELSAGARTLAELLDGAVSTPASSGRDAAPSTSGEATLQRSLSRAQVASGLRAVSAAVGRCDGGAGGTVTVDLTIDGSTGRVSRASTNGPDGSSALGSCVSRAVSRAQFPAFSDDHLTVRNFPFVL